MNFSRGNIILSWALLLSLLLPMGIGVVHAIHQHEINICLAKTESHFHSEKINCDQLHYFSQTIHDGEVLSKGFTFEQILIQNQFFKHFELVHSFPKEDTDRGPPFINVI